MQSQLDTMQCCVRRANADDASEIQHLYMELVGDSNIRVDGSMIESLVSDDFNMVVVAERDGRIVGTAFVVICRDVMYGAQPFAIVENVVVKSSARGQGIGSALMEWIKAACKAKKCTKIMLLSSSKRPDAHRFFEHCGYRGDLKRGFVNYLNR